jgi:hypothetical protein
MPTWCRDVATGIHTVTAVEISVGAFLGGTLAHLQAPVRIEPPPHCADQVFGHAGHAVLVEDPLKLVPIAEFDRLVNLAVPVRFVSHKSSV